MFVNINRVRFPRMKKTNYIDKISLTMIYKGTDTVLKNSAKATASPWIA